MRQWFQILRFHTLVIRLAGVMLLAFLWVTPAWADAPQALQSKAPKTTQEIVRSGIAAFQLQDYATAVDRFSQAISQSIQHGSSLVEISLGSSLAAAYADRCLSYIQLGNYPAAIDDCSDALRLNPADPESLLNRGLSYYRSQQHFQAIADFTQLLQLKPHDPRAYYNRALAQVEQAAYREAIVDYGEALRQTSPLDRALQVEIYTDRGLAQLLQNHQQAAIADFTQAIQFGAAVRPYYNRGCAYHQQGNLAAAFRDFSQALQLDPTYAQAYLSRGLIWHERGERQAAIGDLRQAAECFCEQGLMLAYQQTLDLLQKIQGVTIG
jgi:tetratricopeptide (TPR) repeat protein